MKMYFLIYDLLYISNIGISLKNKVSFASLQPLIKKRNGGVFTRKDASINFGRKRLKQF